VITLDVEMPRMDGIDFLSKLMRLRPMPVLMVSTLTERGAEVTMRALELGAIDFVAKPKIGVADGLKQLAEEITEKIPHCGEGACEARALCPGRRSIRRAGGRQARCGAEPAGPAVDREAHLHRCLHRWHGSHQGSADEPAAGRTGGGHHAAHAAGLHEELRGAAGHALQDPRERSRGR
jgi:CheY-like chemotaxis protein